MKANSKDVDANIIKFLRVLKRLDLLSGSTYRSIGMDLMTDGHYKKDAWRKMNWKEFLKIG